MPVARTYCYTKTNITNITYVRQIVIQQSYEYTQTINGAQQMNPRYRKYLHRTMLQASASSSAHIIYNRCPSITDRAVWLWVLSERHHNDATTLTKYEVLFPNEDLLYHPPPPPSPPILRMMFDVPPKCPALADKISGIFSWRHTYRVHHKQKGIPHTSYLHKSYSLKLPSERHPPPAAAQASAVSTVQWERWAADTVWTLLSLRFMSLLLLDI